MDYTLDVTKVERAENAEIPVSLQNLHCPLLFLTHTEYSLFRLLSLLHRQCLVGINKEFLLFMQKNLGATWLASLLEARCRVLQQRRLNDEGVESNMDLCFKKDLNLVLMSR